MSSSEPIAVRPESSGARMIYALLGPVVRIAAALGFTLKRLRELLDMAYFHQVRRGGSTLSEAADALGVSARKAAQLSRQLKDNFLEPEARVALPRRIEFLLWAEPLSAARIHQCLPGHDAREIDEALTRLESEGRVRRVRRGRARLYARSESNSRLVSPTLQARLDGLSDLVDNVGRATHGLFLRDEQKALIRTVSFYIRPEDLPELYDLYRHLWREIERIEAAAERDPNAVPMTMSFVYSPDDGANRRERRDP